MRIQISLRDSDDAPKDLEFDVAPTATVSDLARAVAERLDVEVSEILDALSIDGVPIDVAQPVSKHPKLHFRRVCVEVHFETEAKKRLFASRARWERVHSWACRVFDVAPDLCANLELHLGEPGGPAINEKERIGEFAGCKVVWLVRPGAEPNGR